MSDTAPAPVCADQPVDFQRRLTEYIKAGYQALYIPSAEESRVEREIYAAAQHALDKDGVHDPSAFYEVISWDAAEGFQPIFCEDPPENEQDAPAHRRYAARRDARSRSVKQLAGRAELRDPAKALSMLDTGEGLGNRILFVFRDLDDFTPAANVRRWIRNLCEGRRLMRKGCMRQLIIISPRLNIDPKLRANLTVVDFDLPNEASMGEVVEYVRISAAAKDPSKGMCTTELRHRLINGLLGLTRTEAEDTLSKCTIRHTRFCEEMLSTILAEKAAIIKKSEVLTYVDERETTAKENLAGFEELFDFVDRRALAYTPEARECGLDLPRGIALIGVPGTGKSVVAAMLGRLLKLPVYTLDIGAVFNALVGESEARMRDALRTVAAQQGAVLMIDEADKGLSGAHTATGDSGVTKRVFQHLLSWLANKKDKTFCVITLNRTDGLPPEFLRKGRFDEIFYVDMPDPTVREEILKIHLRKRRVDLQGLDVTDSDWKDLAGKDTEQFIGAELEEAVIEARYAAFQRFYEFVRARQAAEASLAAAEGAAAKATARTALAAAVAAVDAAKPMAATPSYHDLRDAAIKIAQSNLAKLDAEGIDSIRKFCKDRARPVTLPKVRARPIRRQLSN